MADNIRLYTDGEQATAEVLNRPLGDLEKVGQYISKADFFRTSENNRKHYAGSGLIDYIVSNREAYEDGSWNFGKIKPKFVARKALYNTNGSQNAMGFAAMEAGYCTTKFNVNGEIITFSNNDFGFLKLDTPPTLSQVISDSSNVSAASKGEFHILKDTTRELFIDGDFSEDSILQPYDNGRTTIELVDGKVKVTVVDGEANGYIAFQVPTVKGLTYTLKFDCELSDNTYKIISIPDTTNNSTLTAYESGTYEYTFTAVDSLARMHFYSYNDAGTENSYVLVDNVSLKQTKEENIISYKDFSGGDMYQNTDKFEARDSISRQDLVFLETWHENVADKDIVYPYGNIQYRGRNTDGLSYIAEGTFEGYDTYSLFGDWQETGSLIGKGYKWSELSNEDKLKFAGNKDNNIYKDGDNIIQVRYRIRVIKGLGSKWATPMRSFYSDPYYDGNGGYYNNWIGVKGNKTSVPDLISGDPGACFRPLMIADGNVSNTRESIGVFGGCCRHNPNTFALPLALVQRRNDGAFDPVYNPEGSGTFTDGKEWYETSDSHSSITDCFNNKANGYIGTVSGRPDRLFADEINPVDVEDLRMSAQRKPIVDIFEEQTRLLAGNSSYIIGRENTKITKKVGSFVKASSFDFTLVNRTAIEVEVETQLEYNKIEVGKSMIITFIGDNGNMISFRRIQDYYIDHIYVPYTTLHRAYFYGFGTQERVDKLNSLFPNGTKIDVLIDIDSSYTMNKEVMYSNIIGDPRKLSDRVKYTIVDGTSQTVNLLKNDYVLNDDGHIYRALIARDSIDLDTDDYTNTDNWIDLDTDGSIGGYAQEWLDNGVYGSAAITKQDLTSNLPIDNAISTGFNAYFIRKYNSTKGYLLARKKDGTFMAMNGDNVNIASTSHNAQYNKSEYRFDYSALGYSSMDELRDLCIVIEYQYTNTNVLENDIENNYIYIKKEFNGGNSFYKERGAAIMEDMIKGVITGYGTEKHSFNGYLDVSEETDSKSFYTYTRNDSIPKHTLNPIPTDLGNTYSRTVKYFSFVTKTNGKICINYIFKEIRYDNETGTWGDDGLFHTVGHDGIDYAGTILDDNGLEVMYGEKSFPTPYFIEINKI